MSSLRKSFKTAVLHFTVPTPPFSLTSNIPQGSRMPTPESESTLNVVMDTSSDSLKECTMQMTFVDHVSDPDSLKTGTPAVMLAVAYAYGDGCDAFHFRITDHCVSGGVYTRMYAKLLFP